MFTRAQHKEYMREVWYPRNRKKHQAFVRQHKAGLKIKLWKYKEERGCSKCFENFPPCLDFHHKNGRRKLGDVSVHTLISSSGSWKRILKEIEKCIILCSNCHRKEHYRISVAESSSPV